MNFFPNEPFDSNKAQGELWKQLKASLHGRDGDAYYRYSIFAKLGQGFNREPDVLIVDRGMGICVIECKGCTIANIESIRGQEWKMRDFYREVISPIGQAEDQMYAVKTKVEQDRLTRNVINYSFLIALPFISRTDWLKRSLPLDVANQILFKEDLETGALTKALAERIRPQKTLSDEQWQHVIGILRGQIHSSSLHDIPTGTSSESPIRIVRAIEDRFKTLDVEQVKAAYQIPPGPQRIRGLAGTGKTLLLAKRAAKIHLQHPDWKIAFVFYSRALYQHITHLIEAEVRAMSGGNADVNWDSIKVLHAWGGSTLNGFYSELARSAGLTPLTLNDAKYAVGDRIEEHFPFVCKSLLDEISADPPEELYDVVLIDEGQDLPPEFYRLVDLVTKAPKRIYWAYDEAQSDGSMEIPGAATVFGRNRNGTSKIDLAGKYEGGIDKSLVFRTCYRTPAQILMAAHALHFGLLRKGGPLQGLTTKRQWEALGYDIDGGFANPGEEVILTRPAEYQKHLLDGDTDFQDRAGTLILIHGSESSRMEPRWVAKSISEDLRAGFLAEDILVTYLQDFTGAAFLKDLSSELGQLKVPFHVVETKRDQGTVFKKPGHITVANIHRAKGNEAWKVYLCRCDAASRNNLSPKEEIKFRNQVFVGLTRSRAWCVATGLAGCAILKELQEIKKQFPQIRFPAFNKATLVRTSDDNEAEVESDTSAA